MIDPPQTPANPPRRDTVDDDDDDDDDLIMEGDAEELAELLQLQAEGEEIDEYRLYELQLFDWHKNGWALTEEELSDLEFFREDQRSRRAGAVPSTPLPQTPTTRTWGHGACWNQVFTRMTRKSTQGYHCETESESDWRRYGLVQ